MPDKDKEKDSEVKEVEVLVEPALPKFRQPRSLDEAKTRLLAGRADIVGIAKRAGNRFYDQGMLCIYVKKKLPHGSFLEWIEEHIGFDKRTVQRHMKYAEACNVAEKIILHKGDRSKSDTLSLLPPAEESDTEEKERPQHKPGDSSLWNATAVAKALQRHLEQGTTGRSLDDFDEVVAAFEELAQESREKKAESRRRVRGW